MWPAWIETRERFVLLQEVYNGNGMGPEICEFQASRNGIAIEDVRDRVTAETAFRADGVVRFTNAHLVVFHKIAVTGT